MVALTGVAALALLAAQAEAGFPPEAVPASAPVAPSAPEQSARPAEPPTTEAAQPSPEAGQPTAADAALITVTAKPKNDPLMGANAAAFKLTQDIDEALVEPIAMAYKEGLPKPARMGLHNFIRNISSPIVFINDLLQLKFGRAFKTLSRFLINTTIGVGGLIDVAKDKPFNIPYRHNGFANTLGYYGIGTGPYLYLPFIGPTTLRDVIGGAVDGVILPYGIGAPFNKLYYTLPNGIVRSLDRRVEFDCQLDRIRKSDDPYAAERAYYLKKRQAEIDELHGKGKGPETAAQCEAEAAGEAAAAPAAAPAPAAPPAPPPAPEPAAAAPPSN